MSQKVRIPKIIKVRPKRKLLILHYILQIILKNQANFGKRISSNYQTVSRFSRRRFSKIFLHRGSGKKGISFQRLRNFGFWNITQNDYRKPIFPKKFYNTCIQVMLKCNFTCLRKEKYSKRMTKILNL